MARDAEVQDWRALRAEFIRVHRHEQYQLDRYMAAWCAAHPNVTNEQAEQECIDVAEAWGAYAP